MISSFSNIKSLPDSNPILKKIIRIGDQPPTMVAVLHESIVEQLNIDEQCWFEQVATKDPPTIHLKISSKEIPSRDLTENPRGYRSKDGTIGEQQR
jgi:hypothetical protein